MDTSGERARQGAPNRWAQRARSLGNTVRDGVRPLRAQLARIRERAAAAARGPAVASLTAATGVGSGPASSPGSSRPIGLIGAGMAFVARPSIAQIADAGSSSDGNPASAGDDSRPILISSVEFDAEDPDLAQLARSVVTIRPNFSYTVADISADVQRIFNTGLFEAVAPESVDTRDGVSLKFKLVANPVVRAVVLRGASQLPVTVIQSVMKPQIGKVLNTNAMVAAVHKMQEWYNDKKVAHEFVNVGISADGIIELQVQEPRIGNVEVRFIDRKTREPCEGQTKPAYIFRHLKNIRPGATLSARASEDITDLTNTSGLENVNVQFSQRLHAVDGSPIMDAIVNVTEKQKAGFSGGGGISAKGLQEGGMSALVANADYYRRNLFGKCQNLTARVELSPSPGGGKPDVDVKLSHTDPWIGDSHRTSRRVFLDSDSTSLEPIHAKAEPTDDNQDVDDVAAAGDGPKALYVRKVISGVEYRRPLAASWTGTLSATYQRAYTHDDLKQTCLHDAYNSPLTFSGLAYDTTFNVLSRFVYEGRGKDEALLVLTAEQAVPVTADMLWFNRVVVRARRKFHAMGATLEVAAKGGNIIGDLPPYEAFQIGGANSVRGYPEGGVGTGRKFIVGSAELSVPLAPDQFDGYVFFDIGSDLKSGSQVLGDPAQARGKPGQGYGYGAGIAMHTPVGPIRFEYAVSEKGAGRMHCGLARSF